MEYKKIVTSTFPVPKNYKRGSLIAGKYRKSDFLCLIGAFIWVFALILVYSFVFVWDTLALFLIIIPPVVIFIMTMPHAYHHNFYEMQKTKQRYRVRPKLYFHVKDRKEDTNL